MGTIMAEIGLKVVLFGMEAEIKIICENRLIYCEYINPTKKSGCGGATTDINIRGINGEIVRHPNYSKLLN